MTRQHKPDRTLVPHRNDHDWSVRQKTCEVLKTSQVFGKPTHHIHCCGVLLLRQAVRCRGIGEFEKMLRLARKKASG